MNGRNAFNGVAIAARRWVLVHLLVWTIIAASGSAADPLARYEFEMYEEPPVEYTQRELVFPSSLKPLWTKALSRPDAELQRQMLDTISLAHQRGMPDLEPLADQIAGILRQTNLHPLTARSAVRALVTLDAIAHADVIADAATRFGLIVAGEAEPALIRWHSVNMNSQWLERIHRAVLDPPSRSASSLTSLRWAIEGVAATEAIAADQDLQHIVLDRTQPITLRLAASRALGMLHDDGLLPMAQGLLRQTERANSQTQLQASLMALNLLARHSSDDAIAWFDQVAIESRPPVQTIALERLYGINPVLVATHYDRLEASSDVNVRRWCMLSMFHKRDSKRTERMGRFLDDVNPKLRMSTARAMEELATMPGLREGVIETCMTMLNQDSWRGCQQAIEVLVALNHRPAGERLVALLDHPRSEVKVASAWALRQIDLPEFLPEMLEYAHRADDQLRSSRQGSESSGLVAQIGQLFMMFGQHAYRPAEELMLSYIPRQFQLGNHSRAAATWAIGKLHPNDPQPDLVKLLRERLNDVNASTPEMDEVRQMCVVSLVRMNARVALEDFRKYAIAVRGDLPSRVAFWGIQQFTGETPPPLPRDIVGYEDWWLMPSNAREN